MEANQKLNDQFNKINAKRQEEAKILERIARVEKGARVNKKGEDFNRVAGGLGLGNKTAPALKELNKQLRGARLGLSNLEGRVPKLSKEFAQAAKNVNQASTALDKNTAKLKANAKAQTAAAEAAKRRQSFKGTGGGLAVGASSAPAIFQSGGRCHRRTVGFFTGGKAGAKGGGEAPSLELVLP